MEIDKQICLNADLGEDPAAEDRDIALMAHITRCNIACGGHAGDARSMRAMLRAAAERGVVAGAHPSYPDRANFGRESMEIDFHDLAESVVEQVEALRSLAVEQGQPLGHVKPHGALYNDLAADRDLARALVATLRVHFPGLPLMGLAGGAAEAAARDAGVPFLAEAFIDRRYTPEGRLVPRSREDAVIADEPGRIAQARGIAERGQVKTDTGGTLSLAAATLCIHSDSPGAVATAAAVRGALEEAGISIRPAVPA